MSRFCSLADGCVEAVPKLSAFDINAEEGARNRPGAPDLEGAMRAIAYQMGALLPLTHEAARILEDNGIKVYSRYVPR